MINAPLSGPAWAYTIMLLIVLCTRLLHMLLARVGHSVQMVQLIGRRGVLPRLVLDHAKADGWDIRMEGFIRALSWNDIDRAGPWTTLYSQHIIRIHPAGWKEGEAVGRSSARWPDCLPEMLLLPSLFCGCRFSESAALQPCMQAGNSWLWDVDFLSPGIKRRVSEVLTHQTAYNLTALLQLTQCSLVQVGPSGLLILWPSTSFRLVLWHNIVIGAASDVATTARVSGLQLAACFAADLLESVTAAILLRGGSLHLRYGIPLQGHTLGARCCM